MKTQASRQLSELTKVAFSSTKKLEYTMLPVKFRCWQPQLSEKLLKKPGRSYSSINYCSKQPQLLKQNLEDAFLCINYQSWKPQLSGLAKTKKLVCFLSTVEVHSCSFSYRCYASRHLLELATIAFRTSKRTNMFPVNYWSR